MAWKKLLLEGDAIESPSGAAQGDLLFYDGTKWTRLPAGNSGQILATGGSGQNPYWTDASGTTDEKVKADANDTTAGYLVDKVDGTTIVEDSNNHKIAVGTVNVAHLNIDADLPINYHQLVHFAVEGATTEPNTGNEVDGQMYFNKNDKHLYVYVEPAQ